MKRSKDIAAAGINKRLQRIGIGSHQHRPADIQLKPGSKLLRNQIQNKSDPAIHKLKAVSQGINRAINGRENSRRLRF